VDAIVHHSPGEAEASMTFALIYCASTSVMSLLMALGGSYEEKSFWHPMVLGFFLNGLAGAYATWQLAG
jgi:hypothetical protein